MDVNIEFNKKNLKKTIDSIVRQGMSQIPVKIKCPHCQRTILISSEQNICLACGKEIELDFNTDI